MGREGWILVNWIQPRDEHQRGQSQGVWWARHWVWEAVSYKNKNRQSHQWRKKRISAWGDSGNPASLVRSLFERCASSVTCFCVKDEGDSFAKVKSPTRVLPFHAEDEFVLVQEKCLHQRSKIRDIGWGTSLHGSPPEPTSLKTKVESQFSV